MPIKKQHTTTLQPTTYHWIPRTRHPLPPLGLLLIIRQILSDYLICLHILLRCSRSRHQSYNVFAHGTHLLLRFDVQPNDGHHKGPNMQLLATAIIIYYQYSALELIWARTRAQSGYRYGSGTLNPGQVLRGSFPLLSPTSIIQIINLNSCVLTT